MLRWLLPLVAAIAVIGSSVTAWAGAGLVGDASCCCPVKAKCNCHDHSGEPDPTPQLKRCGGDGSWVEPGVTPTIAAGAPPIASDSRRAVVAPICSEPVPENHTIEPETPPF